MKSRPYLYLSSAEAQLSLGFGEERPTERLFFALLPPPAVAAEAGALARSLVDELGLRGTPIAAERLHVTLHFLGDYAGLPASLVERARQAAAQLRADAFALRLDRVGQFGTSGGRRPCVLLGEGEGIAGVIGLQRELGRVLLQQGQRLDAHYTPHMTLFYDRGGIAARAVAPLAWRVTDLVLIRSVLGHSQYREEGRWPLA